MVAIPDDEHEGGSERATVAETGKHLDLVRLDLLARAAAVTLLPTAKILVDELALEYEPRGQPLEHGDECGSVRLACGCQPEQRHGASVIR
jgi:hypothetical protein